MSEEKGITAQLRRLIRSFQDAVQGDAKVPARVKAVNTILNSGHNLRILDDKDVEVLWDALFFALWFAEMGRGCEEIIAAIERACITNYRLTKVGFQTIAKRWYGLDQYRVDKFSHLARHLLPVLLQHQVSFWLKSCKESKRIGTTDVVCKKLLKRTLKDVSKSSGLCYFLLEILADEISKTLISVYEKLNISVGKFEFKANLIMFLYRQVISFATDAKLDSRLLRSFDQYVIKKFTEELLPNESQLTQILISLRLYQTLDKLGSRTKKPLSGKCKSLLRRWSSIIHETHEKCINSEYFPVSAQPVKSTIVVGST